MTTVNGKLRVFIPGAAENTDESFALLKKELDVVTEHDLEFDPSLGEGVKVAYFLFFKRAGLIFDYKERGLLPDLELVCKPGVGVDRLPLKQMKELGLRLANTVGSEAHSTADMALGLMLASGRNFKTGFDIAMKLPHADKVVSMRGSTGPIGHDVSFSTLGIVGMGSIGYKIAQRAKAFNMDIHYHNRSQRSEEEEADVGATYHADLTSMLGLCDFVIISCPLTPQTTNLFGKEQFKAMKNTAHLINVARGAIVNTDDLVEALTSKVIHAAALDVTEPEPLPEDHPLLKLDNVIVLLHWGWYTTQTREKMFKKLVDNTRALINGQPLPSEVKL